MAAEFARGGKHSDAETMANKALEHVEMRLVSMPLAFVSRRTSVCSVRLAPTDMVDNPQFMNAWYDNMLKSS